ncbi:vWA domain-containing protein [Pseudonocardia asaccharolytica]|uniref:VWA domain-containing protein n=1 Tax=Pseudonocardia asaccharolytica DSM 44247 = NBRC 16224 TaxID=1123024 RepID=A0A511CW83_9PSEU|nr:VWA domain-containing protein [Pseudonocardia asaccharolytica]GEL16836.1 VWA domain-containing protein [Pseudonocardia asaccharolytica DSM 44247 = NBRC 16224]
MSTAGTIGPGAGPAHGLPGHLVDFVGALRRHRVAVGPGETVDAAEVVTVLDLLHREQVREGLAAALLRRSGQRQVFDALFDLYFPAAIGAGSGEVDVPRIGDGDAGPVDIGALRDLLADLLRNDDDAALAELARAAVEALGRSGAAGVGAERSGAAPSWSAYQALRLLSPETLLAQIMDDLRAAHDEEPSRFADEIARRAIRERIARFRAMINDEVRRRTAETLGREQVARTAVPMQAEQVEFLSAYAEQLAQLRRIVHPLARRLASRLAVRRRHAKRGELDMRRTLRRSMSTGGVPIKPAFRTRRPGRPELVVLCDVSGSVAGFSHFTLLLVQALREQFSKVRVFAFVERTDEVTHLFEPGAELSGVMNRVLREARLVSFDGHSDYGSSFGTFAEYWGDAVTPRSSLLILGDARNNYRDPNLTVLRRLVGQTRHAHWLNPEPRRQWGSGDSAALRYADMLPMHECRTAGQLADVVEALLPV